MGSDDRGHTPVEIPTHGDLLAGRLGVEVDQDDVRLSRETLEHAVDDGERVVDGLEEYAALEVDDADARVVPRVHDTHAPARRPFGEVRGAKKRRTFLDVGHDLALVPGVVPAGQDVRPGAEQLLGGCRSDAHAAGRILAIDDDDVGRTLGGQLPQAVPHDLAPGSSDDVTDEQDSHDRRQTAKVTARVSRTTLTLICPG